MVQASGNRSTPTAPLVKAFTDRLSGQNKWRYLTVLRPLSIDHPALPDERTVARWIAELRPALDRQPLSHATRRDYHQRIRTFYNWCRENYPQCRQLPRLRPENFGRRKRRQAKTAPRDHQLFQRRP